MARARVLGCGSNVADYLFRLRALPTPGAKGYFADSLRPLTAAIAGGVTLNHLAWATALGAPTGLLAFQGLDEPGAVVRAAMRDHGVDDSDVVARPEFVTGFSHVMIQADGERSILMAPGSTGAVDAAAVRRHFEGAVRGSALVSTEVSQVPLSGVTELLAIAASADRCSALDLDVAPDVAVMEARLGSEEELQRCLHAARVVKATRHAASQLTLEEAATRLRTQYGCDLVAVTDGKEGAFFSAAGGAHAAAAPLEGITQLDATGAGDAFFGAILAFVYDHLCRGGRMPLDAAQLADVARLASVCGAACCETHGAFPVIGQSMGRVDQLLGRRWRACESGEGPTPSSSQVDAAPKSPSAADAPPTLSPMTSVKRDVEAVCGAAPVLASTAASNAATWAAAAVRQGHAALVTGVGKSAHVGARLAASLRSVGASAHFVHAGEWGHGDLGLLSAPGAKPPLVIAVSNSGETAEVVHALRCIRDRCPDAHLLAVVGSGDSAVARLAAGKGRALVTGTVEELHGTIPSSSIVVQEMACNAIVASVIDALEVTVRRFQHAHPGGATTPVGP